MKIDFSGVNFMVKSPVKINVWVKGWILSSSDALVAKKVNKDVLVW